ncbi:baseplate J/gp47 family protein [Geosporobacter ferrireducens]|uniref:baseplate J/gp47 family protein n=1 Tax=Geosporobacter ferrireducens TaxID=1424294 RepID=UPI00139DDF56|nr:baseplate J/gp47 family protein [Geosporobacter ferrireducens]MTI57493.1 baseplate J/gp47 family protein [Geosporobacter ferrireducens]
METDRTTIQNRMLAGIPEEYDTSEGSFFYDAVKPIAIELETAYRRLEEILDKGFGETAEGEWLDKKAAEQGVYRKKPTKATTVVTITGAAGVSIQAGDKVASDAVTYVCTESKTIDANGQAEVPVECEEYGSIGNVPKGAIRYFPITLSGIVSVTNPEAVKNGYPGETDAELRQRYFDKIRTPATSGNKHHYKNWAREVSGVGDAKVFTFPELPGTVKAVIIDSSKRKAEPELIGQVFDYIEERRPIGAKVIVESVQEVPIYIRASFTWDTDNADYEEVLRNLERKAEEYFKEIAFQQNHVSYAILGSRLLEADKVQEYGSLNIGIQEEATGTICWGIENIILQENEIPVLGAISFE